ncbi:hypothetical protein M378DRAFT_164495 [Amanita muscaria Koide BX008]|uniref:Uncharacterized protein n=1 Tax=Amanita muscaria (strain Koide BX008) TaxID=946122 RepID=A0A0C2X3X2_AMAMK|nr:hypothetical protein M378DRAFT_164495 [Amanita muscaria Koide BX008]
MKRFMDLKELMLLQKQVMNDTYDTCQRVIAITVVKCMRGVYSTCERKILSYHGCLIPSRRKVNIGHIKH